MESLKVLLAKSPVRWFIVGCLTVVIDTSIFITLFHLTNKAVISNLISGTVATCFNYLAHYHWSFTSDRKHSQSSIIYLASFFTFLFLGTYLIKILIAEGVFPLFAKLGVAATLAPISFLLMRFVTFRRDERSHME